MHYCRQILQHACSYLHNVDNFVRIQINLDFRSLLWYGSVLSLMLQAPVSQIKAIHMGCVYVTYLRLTNSIFFFFLPYLG